MSILDYSLDDLLFAHWLKRKREMLRDKKEVPSWLEAALDKLRPIRNPMCSIFVIDQPPTFSV